MNEDTNDTPTRPTADALLPLVHARLARMGPPTLPRLWEGLCARFTQDWAWYSKARGSEDTPEWEEFPYARAADLKPLLDQLGLPYAGKSAPEREATGVPAEASESEPPPRGRPKRDQAANPDRRGCGPRWRASPGRPRPLRAGARRRGRQRPRSCRCPVSPKWQAREQPPGAIAHRAQPDQPAHARVRSCSYAYLTTDRDAHARCARMASRCGKISARLWDPCVGRPASVGGGAMVAQLTLDQKVVGSSPTRPAHSFSGS